MSISFPQKRLLAFESLERLAVKRQRLAERSQQQHLAEKGPLSHSSHSAPSFSPSLPPETEFPQPDALAGIHNAQHEFLCNKQTFSEGRLQETKVEPQSDLNCPLEPLIAILCKKKSEKHKEHKDEDDQSDGWLETSRLKQKASKTEGK